MFVNFLPITNLAEPGPLTWDMAKQIIQSQHSLAIYGITVLVGTAAAVITLSLFWNIFLRRHELEKAIESLRSETTTRLDEGFAKLSERTKDEIEKMENRLKKTVEERMTSFDANTARLFGLASGERGLWGTAASWWAVAIVNFAKVGDESMLRAAVNALDTSLKECKELEDKDRKVVKKCLPSIPEILKEEKEQIEDKLKKLPEETTEH